MSAVCNKLVGGKKSQATAAEKTCNQVEIVELVRKAAAGSFEAFGELYSVYLDQIYRYVFYQVNDKMTAEDVTEEVFIKAWKEIKSCKGREKTFSSWLYRIAHNHLINTLRGNNRIISLEKENSVEITDSKQGIEANIEYRELLEKIACLPRNQKQVIILKFIEGLDNQEISTIMGKKEGAIRISQMRALATLREKLGEEED
jgi:RNA polymerase sigma-70 factor (ECF subfamily)